MDILSILPSLVGLIVAFSVLFTTIRIQDFIRRVDELCRNIVDVAELSVDYWLSNSEESPQIVAMEARILGKQQLVIVALESLAHSFGKLRQKKWSDSLASFIDALTGGDFGNPDRIATPERAKLVQAQMAEHVTTIRKLQESALRIPGIFRTLT